MSAVSVFLCSFVCFLSVTVSIPRPPPDGHGLESINWTHVPVAKRALLKTKWVAHNGSIYNQEYSNCIRIDATTSVSDYAHQLAAIVISKMTTHMSDANFILASNNTKIGVFVQAETLAVYPEYYKYATYQCYEHQCTGTCQNTCTFDGRQIYTLAGIGWARAAISDKNLLCQDGYNGHSNILVHEYTHSIHGKVLVSGIKSRITAAYANAHNNDIWSDSYAMSNEGEYFAVGASVFFHSDDSLGSGGYSMNRCGIYNLPCRSEYAGRTNLYQKDPLLYGILYEVFSDKPAGLKACMTY